MGEEGTGSREAAAPRGSVRVTAASVSPPPVPRRRRRAGRGRWPRPRTSCPAPGAPGAPPLGPAPHTATIGPVAQHDAKQWVIPQPFMQLGRTACGGPCRHQDEHGGRQARQKHAHHTQTQAKYGERQQSPTHGFGKRWMLGRRHHLGWAGLARGGIHRGGEGIRSGAHCACVHDACTCIDLWVKRFCTMSY